MGLKKRLQKLNGVQICNLWELWGLRNQELPSKGQMIDDLSDFVDGDDRAKAELLSDIDEAENVITSFYLHTCPDTQRLFLCETGKDNNIAEIFDVGRWRLVVGHNQMVHGIDGSEAADKVQELKAAAQEIISDFDTYGEVLQIGDDDDDEGYGYGYGPTSPIEKLRLACQE